MFEAQKKQHIMWDILWRNMKYLYKKYIKKWQYLWYLWNEWMAPRLHHIYIIQIFFVFLYLPYNLCIKIK